jgi:flagellin
MRINYNISSIIAQNALNNNELHLNTSTQRLSSGYKINSAKDDAAGLAIARKMNMQIKSLQRANQNANDGVSVVDTADGAMSEMHSILQRMNELAVQSANGINDDTDRDQIQLEIDELVKEIDRIADTTQFNAQNLLDGSFAYKGYTNSENVKVMSYTDDVNKGIYEIGDITYYKNSDEKITYSDGSIEEKRGDNYTVSSADDVKAALNMTDNDDEGVKGFPAGSQVSLNDEYIYISDEDGFEMKLYVNGRENVDAAGLSTDMGNTENVTTNTYKDIKVTDGNGKEYTISRLVTETAVTTTTVPAGTPITSITTMPKSGVNIYTTTTSVSAGNTITSNINAITNISVGTTVTTTTINAGTSVSSIYSGERDGEYTSLEDDLKELGISNITSVSIANDNTIIIEYTDATGTTQQSLTLTSNEGLSNSLYSTSNKERTKYTVVGNGSDDDCIKINITKMGAMLVQTGANEGQQLEIEIPAVNAVNLGVDDLDLSTEKAATEAIGIVGKAINQLSSVRSKIGAYANRLDHIIANLDTTEETMTQSYSRIMDVDMAEEITEYTNQQVLVQAATSVLAQANERPQQVLQLLQ